jgi:hypothetical protein
MHRGGRSGSLTNPFLFGSATSANPPTSAPLLPGVRCRRRASYLSKRCKSWLLRLLLASAAAASASAAKRCRVSRYCAFRRLSALERRGRAQQHRESKARTPFIAASRVHSLLPYLFIPFSVLNLPPSPTPSHALINIARLQSLPPASSVFDGAVRYCVEIANYASEDMFQMGRLRCWRSCIGCHLQAATILVLL